MNISIPGVRIHHVAGAKAICYCPYHKGGGERSPSMEIRLDVGKVRCYACRQPPTSLVALLETLGGLSRAEAVRRVGDFKSIVEAPKKREKLPVCPEYLLGQYLNRRPTNLIKAGFTREILDEMEVGWDPRNYRVIYPIRTPKGDLMGVMGGAIVSKIDEAYEVYYGNAPKYLAYGTREGFPFQVNPKMTLWNYYRVAVSDDPGPIMVVEGFKALMWVRMAGARNVVALCGVGYSRTQVELLAGLQGPFRLFLDNDDAGKEVRYEFESQVRRRVHGVKSVIYPRAEARQPDDLTFDEVIETLGVSDEEQVRSRQDRDQENRPLEADPARPG